LEKPGFFAVFAKNRPFTRENADFRFFFAPFWQLCRERFPGQDWREKKTLFLPKKGPFFPCKSRKNPRWGKETRKVVLTRIRKRLFSLVKHRFFFSAFFEKIVFS